MENATRVGSWQGGRGRETEGMMAAEEGLTEPQLATSRAQGRDSDGSPETATGSDMTLRGSRAEGSCQEPQAGPSRSATPAVPARTRGAACSSACAVASSHRCFSVLTSSIRPWTSPSRVYTLSNSSFLTLSQAWSVYCCVSAFKDARLLCSTSSRWRTWSSAS